MLWVLNSLGSQIFIEQRSSKVVGVLERKKGQIEPPMSCFRSSHCFYRYLFSYYPAALIKLSLNTGMSKRLCLGFSSNACFGGCCGSRGTQRTKAAPPGSTELYCANAFWKEGRLSWWFQTCDNLINESKKLKKLCKKTLAVNPVHVVWFRDV